MKRTQSMSSARPLEYGPQRRGSRLTGDKIHAPPDSNPYDHTHFLDEFDDYLNTDLAARKSWVSPGDKWRQPRQSTAQKNTFPWTTFTAKHEEQLRVKYEARFQADRAPWEALAGPELGTCLPQMHAPVNGTKSRMVSLMTNGEVVGTHGKAFNKL
jgi:hypothetical protein